MYYKDTRREFSTTSTKAWKRIELYLNPWHDVMLFKVDWI